MFEDGISRLQCAQVEVAETLQTTGGEEGEIDSGGDGRRGRARRHHLQGLHHPPQQALAHRRRQGPLRNHVVLDFLQG